ncbi:MAG: hypothetical protein JOY81_02185 [Alphaproteobacteria bacterium]|nr:hypothetical protein [Alphaproteobacteria bacterium]
MNKILLLALLVASPALAQTKGPLDGDWRGQSDGGSCNAPLDYALTIEEGLVDGSATDTTARGPVPNLKKTAPPPPGPGLWQLYGVARPGTFTLQATASVTADDRRRQRLNVTVQGSTLIVTESGGCGRTARLARN